MYGEVEIMDYHGKYDIVGFAHDLGLSLEEVSELYAELIREINSALLELKVLINTGNLVKIQKIIHNIKGVSGNYRITDIYEESTKINDALKTTNFTELEKDLNHLSNISYMALKEIYSFFKQRSIFI
jgi:HPt (histidine-containing phosphotransfer) domain-containing protein